MTQQFENFVNAALDKSLASDVTLPTADEIPVFTGIGRQVTGKTKAELGLATSNQLTDKADLVDGLVPAYQLPGYVDDVLEYANLASFPLLGEASKLYIAIDTNLVYRWGGSTYAVTSSSLALGDTSTTAYRGDRGKTAYNHSQATGNPHNLPAASTSADGYLTSSDWNTFNGKQAALGNVITANTYGSSTQVPVITFNAKGIATTVALATIGAPVLTEANFSVAKTGQPTYTVTWVLTALTDARTWTIPNTNLDFGNIAKIPAVATPYTTGAMAGTRPQCVGGSGNTFSSGTDVVAVGCTSSTLSGTNVTAINVTGLADSAITWANAIVLGSSYTTLPGVVGGGLNVLTNTTTVNNNGAGTYSAVSAAGAVSSSNCVKLALGVISSAVHEIDFIIQHNNDYSNVGTITGKRRVIAFSDNAGAITVSSVNTPYADFVMGSSTGLQFSVTLDTTNNRLIPTLTATGVSTIFGVAMQAKVTSYYTKKAA